MPQRSLYLVFHGLASFIQNVTAKQMDVLLFEMPGHRVALGHWLTEHDLPRGAVLSASGLSADGSAFLDPQTNALVPLTSDPDLSAVYARLTLPLPEAVFSLRRTRLPVTGPDKDRLSSDSHHSVQVFRYGLTDDQATLTAGGASPFSFTSQAVADVPPAGRFLTVVHVLNEPPAEVGDQHGRDEFRKGAAALGADVAITAAVPFPSGAGEPLPPGLLPAEVLPLAVREFHVNVTLLELRRKAGFPLQESIGASRVCGTVGGSRG